MKLKRRIIFCSIYFLAYFVYAMPYSQYIPYLTKIGYSATQRGLMISCYSVMNIVFQLIFGYFSDKYNNIAIKMPENVPINKAIKVSSNEYPI